MWDVLHLEPSPERPRTENASFMYSVDDPFSSLRCSYCDGEMLPFNQTSSPEISSLLWLFCGKWKIPLTPIIFTMKMLFHLSIISSFYLLLNLLLNLNVDFIFTYAGKVSLENTYQLWTDALWSVVIPLKSWQLGFFLPLWDIANAY